MKKGVKRLDPWDLKTGLLGELDGRTQVCLHFHWPSCHVVLIHYTVRLGWCNHLLHGLFPESRLEVATLRVGELYKLINDSGDERTCADLFQKLGMGRSLEKHACRIECNGSAGGQCLLVKEDVYGLP